MRFLYILSIIASLFLLTCKKVEAKPGLTELRETPEDGLTVQAFPSSVTVPINGSVKEAIEKVEIRLFRNGVWLESVKPSVIDYDPLGLFPIYKTNKEKTLTHQIKYYMEEYSYYYETIEVVVNVKDVTPPVISSVPKFLINYGDPKPNLLDGLAVFDDLTPPNEITVSVKEVIPINTKKLGTYQLIYKAVDGAGNETTKESTLTVQDVEAPTISKMKEVKLNLGDRLEWEEYYKITDNCPTVIKVELSRTTFDEPGFFEVTITATDQSENKATYKDLIEVLAPPEEEPKMTILLDTIEVEYQKGVNSIDLVRGNVEGVDLTSVRVSGSYNLEKIGTYPLKYQYIKDTNEVIQELPFTLKVVDNTPPTIDVIKDLIIPYGETTFISSDYFLISDNYDSYSNLKITKKGSIDLNKLGRYEYEITVVDTSGNKLVSEFVLEVKDIYPPTILNLPEKLEIQQGTKLDLSSLEIVDNYDKRPSYEILIEDGYENKIGTYQAEIIVKDLFSNTKSYFVLVEVFDSEPPEIVLHNDAVTININSEPINYTQMILEVVDGNNYLEPSLVEIEDNVDYQKIGIYEVFLTIKDENGNEGAALITVTVDDFKKPEIRLSNLKINKGDNLDLWRDVEILDDSKIKIKKSFPNQINTNEPGTYEINYYVADERGNYTSAKRVIEVVNHKAKYQTPIKIGVAFIGCALLTTISLFGLKYFKKRPYDD